jgi:hypothetical protein
MFNTYTDTYRAADRRDKALGIEIYNARQYLHMRRHWNGAGGLLLHEYCHLIHQHVFGLDCLRIQRLYAVAVVSQRHGCVPRRDWAGRPQTTDLAYCMVDHKEFFAELSVTYWSRGYTELDTARRDDVVACSPPLLDEAVLARVARLRGGSGGGVAAAETATATKATAATTTHCNKFYPFTSGQFRHCDPEMYAEFAALWQMVSDWDDPHTTTIDRDGDGDPHECFPGTILTRFTRPSLVSQRRPGKKSAEQPTISDPITVSPMPFSTTMTHYQIMDTVDL